MVSDDQQQDDGDDKGHVPCSIITWFHDHDHDDNDDLMMMMMMMMVI